MKGMKKLFLILTEKCQHLLENDFKARVNEHWEKKNYSGILVELFKGYVYIIMYVNIKVVWFFSLTKVGHFFYNTSIFLLVVHEYTEPWYLYLFLFVCLLVGGAIELFFLINYQPSRKRLNKLLGDDFIKSHLGNPGKEMLKQIFIPLGAFLVANQGAKMIQYSRNVQIADSVVKTQKDMWQEIGYNPTHGEYQNLVDLHTKIMLRPHNGLGDTVKDLTKLIRELFN